MQLLKSMTTLKTITKKKCFKVLFKNRYALRLFAYLRDIVLWLNSQWKLGDCCIWKINGKACRWIKFEAAKCPQFFPFFLLFLQRQNRFETKRARSTRGLGWGLRAKLARRILRWHPGSHVISNRAFHDRVQIRENRGLWTAYDKIKTNSHSSCHLTDSLNILFLESAVLVVHTYGVERHFCCVHTFPAHTLLIYNKIWDVLNWVRICPINDKV